ncbi:MAG: hypothetical protein ACKOFA_02655 [Rhodoluna sp.]
MQPPKNRFTTSSNVSKKPASSQLKPTPKNIPPKLKREVRKEARRFSEGRSFKKYFL